MILKRPHFFLLALAAVVVVGISVASERVSLDDAPKIPDSQTSPRLPDESTGETKLDEEYDDVAQDNDRKVYRNEEYGFEIKLPVDWTTTLIRGNEVDGNYIAIRDEKFGILHSDSSMAIFFPDDIEKAIDKIGGQFFSAREVKKESIEVNGIPAILVTVTTSTLEGWKATAVFINQPTKETEYVEFLLDMDDDRHRSVLRSFSVSTG